jgi:SAM-dependent methyltransferase
VTDRRRDLDQRRASFLSAGTDYERTRPGYPRDAITWMIRDSPKRVIDLGCGPGKLTALLAELGHDAIGVDPSLSMLETMRSRGMPAICGRAEAIPLRDGCTDVVTAATAFHWFDAAHAVPEIHRVLRPNGTVALITHFRDESVDWVKALSDIVGSETAMAATLGGEKGMEALFSALLEDRGFFRDTEHRVFGYEQPMTEDALVGLIVSRSYIAILPKDEKDRIFDAVRALCRTHPDLRGAETFALPYRTHAFRAHAATRGGVVG